ncbi:MAG: MFS transporter [Chloroflexi bacterium]|uniref:MFS transporter n=1 Tax=Candidatus Flexifilum breve TaxID=3140694 RepID=UPI0031347B46|nr:MFS transporter [Chloroflexota bacterium]MBK9747897.1 MFS transporter [Chloroflexota bacterium]
MTNRLDFDRAAPIFVLTLVDVLGLTVLLPLLHLYAARFGATPLQIGLVLASFPLTQLIGVPLMGALSDRFGRKPLLLISQITTCIGFIMLGAATSLEMVILSRVIDGLFGANLATAQAALSDITTDETRAQGLGLTGAAFGLGFVFGPLISILTLEVSDNLALPAFVAAIYSLISIFLTLFMFKETLPAERRGARGRTTNVFALLKSGQINLLLVLMFAQQFAFFAFESLLGLFTLSRLGLLGQGTSLIFIVVGVTLVYAQIRLIGRWTRKYGERRVVLIALLLLAAGLVLVALTPEQPHPFYVQRIVERALLVDPDVTSTEAVIGDIAVQLPPDGQNGVGGLLWMFIVIVPLTIGAGMIRPSLNSLMTKRVGSQAYGGILGLSASAVSAANAAAPIVGGLIFQQYGASAPFLLGGLVMAVLSVISFLFIRQAQTKG